MTKHLYILLILLAFSGVSWSQSDQEFVYWQQSVGSQGEDQLNDMVHDADGNVYVVGSTQANGSQSMDVLVSKLSRGGNQIWSKTIGESGDDLGLAIELLNGELFVLVSSTSSTGIFAGNMGREDIFLIRLNLEGSTLGAAHFGGDFSDIPTDLTKTTNGELIIAAHSQSSVGFFDSNKGQSDLWVFRVNAAGELIWKHNYGGSEEDFSVKIETFPNGEIAFFGHSSSFDGDIGVNFGDLDLSLFKLSSTGTILWEQNYGGLQSEIGVDLMINDYGQIFLAGNTSSSSYDITKNAGFSDAWVLEIDPADGNIVWEETHGSEGGDYAAALALNQYNELYLMGTTNASVFFGEQSAGGKDAWLAKVNAPESIDHVALFGGNGFETIADFSIENDGSILLLGASSSSNDLFSANKGRSDGWIMKVAFDAQFDLNSEVTVSAHPNPTNGIVYLNNLVESDEIVVFNSMGQVVVESFSPTAFSEVLDLGNFNSGVYLIKIQRSSDSELIRLVRN